MYTYTRMYTYISKEIRNGEKGRGRLRERKRINAIIMPYCLCTDRFSLPRLETAFLTLIYFIRQNQIRGVSMLTVKPIIKIIKTRAGLMQN